MSTEKKFQPRFENRGMRPYFSFGICTAYSKLLPEYTGFGYENMMSVVSPDMMNQTYFEISEMQRATEHFAKIWQDKVKTEAILQEIKKTYADIVPDEERGWKLNWQEMSTQELLTEAQYYYERMIKTVSRFNVSQPQHISPLDEKITELLKDKANADELMRVGTHVQSDLPWSDEDRDIEKLHDNWNALDASKQNTELQKLIKKYGWLNDVEGEASFDSEHYRQKILNYKKEENNSHSKIEVPSDVYEVGQLIGELGHLRFWGRFHWMQLRYHLKSIVRELARRSDKPFLEYGTIDEIFGFFKGDTSGYDEMEERKREGYVIYLYNNYPTIVTGQKAVELRNQLQSVDKSVTDIKGRVANKGKAVGRVRVISFSAQDYSDQVAAFKKGEILVCGMTRPQIVHLCTLAAAIVTDEGGITSHAAVVSRELNVPCVIATHNATKVLKTGDMVEVDANNGIVTILKS